MIPVIPWAYRDRVSKPLQRGHLADRLVSPSSVGMTSSRHPRPSWRGSRAREGGGEEGGREEGGGPRPAVGCLQSLVPTSCLLCLEAEPF